MRVPREQVRQPATRDDARDAADEPRAPRVSGRRRYQPCRTMSSYSWFSTLAESVANVLFSSETSTSLAVE